MVGTSEWAPVRIRDVAKIVGGGTPSRKNPSFFGGEVPWITPKDLSGFKHRFISRGATNLTSEGLDRSSARLLPVRAVLFSSRAPIGYVALAQQPLATNQGFRSLICNEDLAIPEFLFYSLKANVAAIESIASGSTFKEISGKALGSFQIPLPTLATQRRVVAILSAYDDLIENGLRRIEILEEMARNLYREWFVQFRFPGHESVEFVESPLGRIPDGWRIGPLAEVARLFRGKSYRSQHLVDSGGRPFVSLKCVERGGGFRTGGLKAYDGPYTEEQTVRTGEVLVAITDMNQERLVVARSARVPRLGAPFAVISMDLVRVATRGSYPDEWLYSMLRWSRFADEVKQHANGANVLHLLPDRIAEYCFPRPPCEVATEFSDLVSPLFAHSDSLQEKNYQLRQVRDLLLPRLISGEIDVSDLPVRIESPTLRGVCVDDITRYDFFRRITALPFVDKVVLFGSRARGDHESRSDIDLAVFCEGATDDDWLDVLACLREDRIDTLRKVDCVRFEEANKALRENVIAEGVVLYDGTSGE